MFSYESDLKRFSRSLRKKMTDVEIRLWMRLKRKQISNVQFYRQKPIGKYIVDFYAPKAGLVIELDGSQHFSAGGTEKDAERDAFLATLDLHVLRFNNLQVLQELEGVLCVISQVVESRICKIPLPPFSKGDKTLPPAFSRGSRHVAIVF